MTKKIRIIIPILFLLIITSCSDIGDSNNVDGNGDDRNQNEKTSVISQFGITWTFDKEYEYGQFANGDYWVVGPVTIVDIDPASVEVDGRTMHGSMINPSPLKGVSQGYDTYLYESHDNFDDNLNVARPNGQDLSLGNLLNIPAGSSLVSTRSVETINYPELQTAAILTVLDSPAPAGSFRPPYCGSDKIIEHNIEELDYSLLKSLVPVAATPNIQDVTNYFEKPWIDHIPGFLGRDQHPIDNMPDYGREIAAQISIGALMLHLDFSDEEKEMLLIRYVQLGVDLFGVVQDGGRTNWVADGGHSSGRKWPILFAGIMLSNDEMMNIGEKSGDYLNSNGYGPGNPPPDYIHFGEDAQTFYVNSNTVTYGIGYSGADIGLPEWGINHETNPSVDKKDWTADYRQCCTAIAWSGFVLAAGIMDVKDLWNHNVLFDYQDRYNTVETDWISSGFEVNMWNEYRDDYGCVWTRTDPDDEYSQGDSDCND